MRVPIAALVALAACAADPVCETQELSGGKVCDAEKVAADKETLFDVLLDCLGSCGDTTTFCEVRTIGRRFEISLKQQVCSVPGETLACPAICQILTLHCVAAPAPAGTYDVVLRGVKVRQITVEDGAPATCTVSGNQVP